MKTLVMVLLLGIGACQAPVGVQNVELPPDSAAQCAAQCHSIQLALDSVVVMANNVGCVCRPPVPPAGSTTAAGTSSAGGMTAILIAREEARRQEAARQQRAQQQRR